MKNGFPALPHGFEVVEEQSAAPVADSGFAPLPEGFSVETPAKPRLTPQELQSGVDRILDDDKLTPDQRVKAANDFALEGGWTEGLNQEDLVAAAKQGRGARVKQEQPGPRETALTDDQRMLAERTGSNPDAEGVEAFLQNVGKVPYQMLGNFANLVLMGYDKVTGEDTSGTRDTIRQRIDDIDAVTGESGAGELTGEIITSLAFPMSRVTRFGKGANIAATGAKRAASGAAIGGTMNADSDEQQIGNMVITAAAMPFLIPAAEKLFGAVGAKATNLYLRVAGQGVGKKIYDTEGALTTFGRALRARLRAVNPDIPEEMIDDTLAQIVKSNPRTLPKDEAIVPEMLAQREKVPLTGGMVERDVTRVQDFEAAQMGTFGKGAQDRAIAADSAIDDAVRGNVKAIGTGGASDDAARNIGTRLTAKEEAAVAAKNELYEPLKNSDEGINIPSSVGKIYTEVLEELGPGGVGTLGEKPMKYLERITTMRDTPQSMGGAASIRFGDFWKLSRDINAAVRGATGDERFQLGVIKEKIDDFIRTAPDYVFEKGSNGVFKLLQEANRANKKLMDTFGARNVRTRSGTNIPDNAGKAVERIIALGKAAKASGDDIEVAKIETAIFGQWAAMNSASAKQAVSTIRRVIKAAPEVAQDIKNMAVNRVLRQMEQGLFNKALKPDKMQTTVRQLVEENRQILEAAGFTKADITRLQTNAYLAALKTLPAGARNPSGSGKMIRKGMDQGFRRLLATALGGGVGVGTGGNPLAMAAAFAAIEGGGALLQKRLANKALSSSVRRAGNAGGRSVGQRAGRVGAATFVRQFDDD